MFYWNHITKWEAGIIFLLNIIFLILIRVYVLPEEKLEEHGLTYGRGMFVGLFTYLLFASLYLAFKKIVKKHHTKYKQKN